MYSLDIWQWLCIVIVGFGCMVWWLFYWTGKKELEQQKEWNDRILADRRKHRQVGRVVAPPMDGRFPPVKLPFHKPAVRGKPEMNRRRRDTTQSTVQSQAQQQSDDGFVNGLLFGAVIGSSHSDHSSHDTPAPYSGGGGEFGGGGASSSWNDSSSSSSSDCGSSSSDSSSCSSSD